MPQITVNGKTYINPDDIPPDAHETYQKALEILHDADKNGIPDFLEGKPLEGVTQIESTVILDGKSHIIFDGKSYANVDELPPAKRIKYDQAVAKLGVFMSDSDGNGTPDILDGKVREARGNDWQARQPTMPEPVGQNSMPSVFHDESPNYARFFSMAIIVLLAVAILGFGVFLFQLLQK